MKSLFVLFRLIPIEKQRNLDKFGQIDYPVLLNNSQENGDSVLKMVHNRKTEEFW